MSDFQIELLMSEIKVVQNTERGEHFIEASAEQIMEQHPHEVQADMLKEFARVYASNNGGGALADRIIEIVEDSMTESGARSMINTLIGKYMR